MTNKIEDFIKLADGATKGPWIITNEGYDSHGSYKHQIGTNEVTVAYTWAPCDYSPPPSAMVANCHLIALSRTMAPALAKALLEAEEALKFISQMKSAERIRQDAEAMIGRIGPDYETLITAMYQVMKSRGDKALATIQKIKS